MSSKTQNFIATVSILCLLIVLGCASFQDALTPCYVSPAVIDYADANGTSILPWTTLFDAKRIGAKMDYVHSWNQLSDKMKYEYLSGIHRFHIAGADELKTSLFSPTGPLALIVPTGLAATAGALLFSKPTDKKKIKELESNAHSANSTA
ncbi:hypothetical protein ES703_62705 [subsurface metagenome]